MDSIEEVRLAGTVTATGQLVTGAGHCFGLSMLADGTHAQQATVYDNTSAAGTVVGHLRVSATGVDRFLPVSWKMRFVKGLFASIAGAGTGQVTAFYK